MRLPKPPIVVEIAALAGLYVLVLWLVNPRRGVLPILVFLGIYVALRGAWAVRKRRAADRRQSR